MSVNIAVGGAGTFYTRHGDMFAATCVIMAIALLAFAFASGFKLSASRRRPLYGLIGRVGHYPDQPPPGSPAVIDRHMTD